MDRKSAEMILYGSNPLQGVVAVEHAGRFCRLFIRNSKGVSILDHPFEPFLFLEDPEILNNCPVSFTTFHLYGDSCLKFLVTFESWQDCCWSKDFLEKIAPVSGIRFQFVSDPVHQFLLTTGITLFNGLNPSDIRVMAMAITDPSGRPARKPDSDLFLSVACSNGCIERLPLGKVYDYNCLDRIASLIAEQDPDIIVARDIIHGTFAKLSARVGTEIRKLRLRWGRNGSFLRFSGLHGDSGGELPVCDLYGRSMIDIRSISRVDPLKQLRRTDSEDQELTAEGILEEFRKYAPLLYSQAGIFPYSFQVMLLRNEATKANSLLLREYIRRNESVAPAEIPSSMGHTDPPPAELTRKGLLGPVARCDIASLNSSIMLSYRLKSSSDRLGILLPFTAALRKMVAETPKGLRSPLDAAMSNLVNSFPSMLGARLNFADMAAAGEVFRLGRVITRDMAGWITEQGGEPVVAGRNEIFFIPPAGHDGSQEVAGLMERLSETLPGELSIQLSGVYRSMLLYKPGNFALLDYDGCLYVKGSTLNSRGGEPYLNEFLTESLHLLLEGRSAELKQLHEHYLRKLRTGDHEIHWIARTETVADPLDKYLGQLTSGTRNRSAPYEVALRRKGGCSAGEKISYYIIGSSPDITLFDHARDIDEFVQGRHDINVSWYSERLNDLLARLTEYIPEQPALF